MIGECSACGLPIYRLPLVGASPSHGHRKLSTASSSHHVRPPTSLLYALFPCSSYEIGSGAGLGGLIFALFLQKTCPEVCLDIYESAHELSEIGAGISVWPRTLDVLKYLDLEDDLLQAAGLSREGD